MEISVLLESIENNGYRASMLAPEPLVAEAPTRQEAVEQLRELVRRRFSNAELVRIDVSIPGETHPWKSIAGTWQNHPDAADFEESVSAYRKRVDSDPGRP